MADLQCACRREAGKIAPRFGITLADLKRVNSLNGRIKTMPTTLLVPATDGVARPTWPACLSSHACPRPTRRHAEDTGREGAKRWRRSPDAATSASPNCAASTS